MTRFRRCALAFVLSLLTLPAAASDHADPQFLDRDRQEANLTGLFFFPEGDDYIAVLNVRRALTGPPPYRLAPYEYSIHLDFHTPVSFDDAESLARYGGTVERPEGISPDVSLSFRLNDDATLRSKRIEGLASPESVRIFTGVRDDPFIFPRFFGVNVISMVAAIPRSALPADRTWWLLWGTSSEVESGRQIDHVGRSNRTQLGRFDVLNTVAPGQHLAKLEDIAGRRERIQSFLEACIPPLGALNQLSGLKLRHYDFVPDVMIFASERPPGFPNGRRLTDDVAELTCDQGDCPLQENAFIDTDEWPRRTVNDKPFLAAFPYVAEPWPERPQSSGPSCRPYVWRWVVIPLVVLALAILGIRHLRRRGAPSGA